MIPLTRKENYLNEIVGWGETAPEKPLTPEEFFFAAILGEAVQVPDLSNASRYELFLAKIAGYNVNISPPTYTSPRLELFLAKACGMDIETPTPITREEIFWSNYSAIVDFEVEGVPPLTYKAIEGTLENYRIYGNTVGGESVGDRTANLFDGEWEQGSFNETLAIGTPFQNTKILIDSPFYNYRVRTANICNIKENSVISFNDTKYSIYIMYYDADSCYTGNHSNWITTSPYISNASNVGIAIKNKSENLITPDNVADINFMLNSGSEPLPYEPYGYRVPVTVTNGTDTEITNLYLPEQIKIVGDEAEYIDYGEQKMHRIGADDINVTLLALPTLTGTNVLSVGTAVQSSKVMIKTGKFGTHKVRYYDSDGTFLSAEDVKDGTNAQGFTPTKTSTVQYNYTFMGWSTTKGSTTAETGVLNDITADKSLYAVFSQSLRTFTVYFYNDSTLLQTAENVQYGGTATYTGEAPTKDGFAFTGWLPSNVNITADTSCYAQFTEG